jgi:hypothetical protein
VYLTLALSSLFLAASTGRVSVFVFVFLLLSMFLSGGLTSVLVTFAGLYFGGLPGPFFIKGGLPTFLLGGYKTRSVFPYSNRSNLVDVTDNLFISFDLFITVLFTLSHLLSVLPVLFFVSSFFFELGERLGSGLDT